MADKKQKIGLSLSADILTLEQEHRSGLGFGSRSELVEAALFEYITKGAVARYAETAARIYEEIEQQALRSMEQRLAKLGYKLAIEMAQINLLFAKAFDLDRNAQYELRKHAHRLVEQSHGFISLAKAATHAPKMAFEIEDYE